MSALILLALHTPLTAQKAPDAFAIRNVRVFDGDRVLPAATVMVRGGRIAQVSTVPVRVAGIPEIDGSGHTLLPGLIDAHVHTAGDRQALIDAARYGVTTVVEILAAPANMRALRQRITAAPGLEAHLFCAGGAATAPGGHAQFSGRLPCPRAPGKRGELRRHSSRRRVAIHQAHRRRERRHTERPGPLSRSVRSSPAAARAD